jgi:hypothetical protein
MDEKEKRKEERIVYGNPQKEEKQSLNQIVVLE